MRRKTVGSAGDGVRERLVLARWRASGCAPGTVQIYVRWARRWQRYCARRNVVGDAQLSLAGTRGFVHAQPGSLRAIARTALHALACALQTLGHPVPSWREVVASAPLPPLLQAFADFRRQHAGISSATLAGDLRAVALLGVAGRDGTAMRLSDLDRLIVRLAQRLARKTVARICTAFRAWFRFLRVSGRISTDLASAIVAPRVVTVDRPPRALPWCDVRRILRGIDVKAPHGRRDFAMLLVMATYGLGAGEVRALCLDDIDWRKRLLHIRRPKTHVHVTLPLLDAVAKALASYVRTARPRHATTRHVFVSAHMPHAQLTASSAIRHRLVKHAHHAGVVAEFLGSHALRHSHAMRQIELHANPKVVSDILGHRRPSSTSVYVRVATERLRALALPVPR